MPAQAAVSGGGGPGAGTLPRVRVAGIVLAAGRSSRMGPERNKLVEPIAGRPLVAWPVDALLEAGVDPVLVVTGFEAERVQSALGGSSCRFVRHERWSEGMGSSLARGMRELLALALWPPLEAVLVCVGDLPGLRAEHVTRVIEAALEARAAPDTNDEKSTIPPTALVVPTHATRRGHPVLFGSRYFADLARVTGDEGARSILIQNKHSVNLFELDSPAILADIDTPVDLAEARSQHELKPVEKR